MEHLCRLQLFGETNQLTKRFLSTNYFELQLTDDVEKCHVTFEAINSRLAVVGVVIPRHYSLKIVLFIMFIEFLINKLF